MKTIHYKKSIFYCKGCSKLIKGEGFLYNLQPLCTNHYKEIFPDFKNELETGQTEEK